MIDHFLRDASGVLSWPLWSIVLQSGVLLPIHTLKLPDRAVSGARLLTGGVIECDIAHRRSVAVLCVLCEIRCATWTVCASMGSTRCPGRTWVHLCDTSLQNLVVPLEFCSPLSVPLERSC